MGNFRDGYEEFIKVGQMGCGGFEWEISGIGLRSSSEWDRWGVGMLKLVWISCGG